MAVMIESNQILNEAFFRQLQSYERVLWNNHLNLILVSTLRFLSAETRWAGNSTRDELPQKPF